MFAENNGPSVPEHGEIPELMTSIGLGKRFVPSGTRLPERSLVRSSATMPERFSPMSSASSSLKITSSGWLTGVGESFEKKTPGSFV